MQEKVDWTICGFLKTQIETFKRTMPLIQDLKNPAMRERHWTQLKEEVQKPFDQNSETASTIINLLYGSHFECGIFVEKTEHFWPIMIF